MSRKDPEDEIVASGEALQVVSAVHGGTDGVMPTLLQAHQGTSWLPTGVMKSRTNFFYP